MSKLEIQSLTLSVADKLLCKDLNFLITQNESWALLGKNGVGKTSLLHSIAGLKDINAGDIKLNNRSLQDYNRAELAKEIGILFQDGLETLPATVIELVMLGRHPHAQSIFNDSEEDIALAFKALKDFSLTKLGDRKIDSLSGGEKQRAAIAMLITQEPNFFLLDEPSNHLDVAFQVSILNKVKEILNEKKASMLMATHDINLAARFCNKFVLLLDNGENLCGDKDEILDPDKLSDAYGCKIKKLETANHMYFYLE